MRIINNTKPIMSITSEGIVSFADHLRPEDAAKETWGLLLDIAKAHNVNIKTHSEFIESLKRENHNLRQIERNVQNAREHEYKRAHKAEKDLEKALSAVSELTKVNEELSKENCALKAERDELVEAGMSCCSGTPNPTLPKTELALSFIKSTKEAERAKDKLWLEYKEKAKKAEAQTAAALDVIMERNRQLSAEGWTEAHDAVYTSNELPKAALCYLAGYINGDDQQLAVWPWDSKWWKPTTPRRNLIKAAALIIAEIDRLDKIKKD